MPTLAIVGNAAAAVLNVSHAPGDRAEMTAVETHGIAHWSTNRLLLDSTGLGWHDAYTSLAVESPWRATLPALPHLGLAYFVRSSARIDRRVEGAAQERAELEPGLFGMIPADRPSDWHVAGEPHVQLVYLRRDTIDELAVDAFDTEPAAVEIAPRLGFRDDALEPLVVALLGAARRGDPTTGPALWADHVIRMIGLELLERYSNLARRPATSSDATPARLAAAREYVEANLTQDLTLRSIALEVGMRPHRLARDFRAATGIPLHQYVVARRVTRAARLLRTTNSPIATIAAECGFADQSHMTNAFRRRFGVTPAAYRAG